MSVATATFSSSYVGTNKPVTIIDLGISGVDAGNYTLTEPTGFIADITKKQLIVTADDKTVIVGDELPDFTVSYSGFVAGEDFAVLDTLASATSDTLSTNEIANYTIKASGGGDNNYSYTYVNGVFNVEAIPMTLDEEILDDMYLEIRDTIIEFPTANEGEIVGTTTDKMVYYVPDSYMVTWNYTNDNNHTLTQKQKIIVYKVYEQDGVLKVFIDGTFDLQWYIGGVAINAGNDLAFTPTVDGEYTLGIKNGDSEIISKSINVNGFSPIPDVESLQGMIVEMNNEITLFPTADSGEITATTNSNLVYNTSGTYIINWDYMDDNYQTYMQPQEVAVFNVIEESNSLRVDVEGDFNYQWYLNGDPIFGANNKLYSPIADGNYTVEISSETVSCISENVAFGYLNTDINYSSKFEINPNPTTDFVNIKNHSKDLLGIKVFDARNVLLVEVKSDNSIIKVDLTKCAVGVLMVTIKNEDEIIIKKIIKK